MAITLQTLIQRTRRYTRDWPDQDALTTSVTSGATTLNVADSTLYYKNEPIQIDQEMMLIRALPTGLTLTVARGMFGSTAASHASGVDILIRPRFWDNEITDAINAGIDACFPYFYKEVLDTTTTAVANQYEYTIPNMPGTYDSDTVVIPYISEVDIKEPGDFSYRPNIAWTLKRGATPVIKFKRVPVTGSTIRVRGYGPFPHLANLTDTLDNQWPRQGNTLPVEFAVSRLLMSGEALRVRSDMSPVDSRESANRPGSSSSAAQAMLNRFNFLLRNMAMPAMPKNVQSVF